LIQPVPSQPGTPAATEKPKEELGGGGNGGGNQPPANTQANGLGNAREKYLTTLIKLFEEKAANGEMDEKLMERIERLLGSPAQTGNA